MQLGQGTLSQHDMGFLGILIMRGFPSLFCARKWKENTFLIFFFFLVGFGGGDRVT